MAVNRYAPHLWVVPEDDANRQLANGFQLHLSLNGCIHVAPPCGGWAKVLDQFEAQHVTWLRKFPLRHLVLLIDFDGQFDTRSQHFRNRVPDDVSQRVYVLGTSDEPEPLRAAMGKSLERIGESLAQDCADENAGLWEHEMLRHNRVELDRLTENVRPFLFN